MVYLNNTYVTMDENSKHVQDANYVKPSLASLGSVETMTRTHGYGGNHFGWHPWHPPRRDRNHWDLDDCFSI